MNRCWLNLTPTDPSKPRAGGVQVTATHAGSERGGGRRLRVLCGTAEGQPGPGPGPRPAASHLFRSPVSSFCPVGSRTEKAPKRDLGLQPQPPFTATAGGRESQTVFGCWELLGPATPGAEPWDTLPGPGALTAPLGSWAERRTGHTSTCSPARLFPPTRPPAPGRASGPRASASTQGPRLWTR